MNIILFNITIQMNLVKHNETCHDIKTRLEELERKGISLEDPKDVERAVDIAMTEALQTGIDTHLHHYLRV